MAIRRIYKRDKDGQFAKVNTLINKVERIAGAGRATKRILSPSEKGRLKQKKVGKGGSAAGSLSLAMDPAKVIAREHDLSGDNRSEANKAAYRHAGKLARELKLKHGDRAPTADKIYSTAKKMQLGGYTNKAGQKPYTAKDRKPFTPRPVNGKKPDAPKPPAGGVKAGTRIAGTDLKRGDVIQVNNGKSQYVVVANDGTTITAEKLGQYKVSHVRFKVSDIFDKVGEGKEPRRVYGSGPGAPKPKGNTILPMNKLEGLNTTDLIDQYNLADQAGNNRVKSRALQWLKARAKTGDAEASAFFNGNPDGPKLDPPSIIELNKRIARAAAMLRSSPTSEEKQIYQEKIDSFNAAIRDRLDNGTIDELSKDLKAAQRELVNARRDVTTYKSRINRHGDANGGYKSMLENAQRDVNVSLGTVKRIEERIAELRGKAKAQDDKAKALKKKGFSALPRNEVTDPPPVRWNREAKVRNAFDSWFNGYYTIKLDNANEAAGGDYTDWKDKFQKDEAFRKESIAKFVEVVRNPSPLNNRDGSWTYRELTERNGYNDLTPQQRKAIAESDGKLLEAMFDPKVAEARMENGFKNWLETSEGAHDLAKNYDYDTDSLFEIFMDGNSEFPWRAEYINNYDIAERYRKFFRESKFDGAALARLPRPEKVDPEKVAPVPYRAKNSSVGELRREKESREKELAFGMTKVFGNAETFGKLTPEQQDAERAKYRQLMEEIVNLGNRIEVKKPDLSREIRSAKDFDEAYNIFSDRNPDVALGGWAGEGSAIELTMEKGGVYGPEHRKIVLARVVESLEAAESMHKRYPEVPFDGFNALEKGKFSGEAVMAHCARGVSINIEVNTDYLVNKSPTSGDPNFHPKDLKGTPWGNTVVHEFGHSMDWFAFRLHDLANDRTLLDRNEGKGIRRDKIWAKALEEHLFDRDKSIKQILVQMYNKYQDEGLFSGTFMQFYEKYTSGYARKNYHELIAESWQDVDSNGALATPISQAIVQFVMNNYNLRVKEGKAPPYDLKAVN